MTDADQSDPTARPRDEAAVLILAGGRASRLGGADKALCDLGGRSLLAHAILRLAPQAGTLLLSANGDPSRFAAFGLPVVADGVVPGAGPLAGILAGMEWLAAHRPDCAWMVSVPVDLPFLPPDLVARLRAARERSGADIARAASAGRVHPATALWPLRLAGALRRALVAEGLRKVTDWTARYATAEAEWPPGADGRDPFFNINTPADLEAGRGLAAGGGSGRGASSSGGGNASCQ